MAKFLVMKKKGSFELFYFNSPKFQQTDAGMKPIIPEGGYFMVADWTALGMI